ncbi:hypothetical protein DH2020_032365 [Rehmannia glutinosa]|uniref:Uncharacterized protein n=1 Tax=Rehmannia glutinosa TaxID=99300 RepID=A0ABR0VIH7_REHGL
MVSLAGMGKEVPWFSSAMNLLYFLLFLYILSSVSGQFCDERTILLEFKKSLSDPYGILNSWNADNSNHCSWFGVSCNVNSSVSGVKIGGNFSLSPSCSLKSELSLHGFGMKRNCSDSSEINGKLLGRISGVIGKLTELRVLSLPFNELVGGIPVEIWGLKNLEVLDLEGNDFVGDFSGYDFTGLRRLRVLNLASNRISGMIPPSLSKCRGLRILNLAGNEINDVIPEFVGRFRKLRVVNLSFNRLVGRVPSNLGYGCGNLEHLDLSNNFLKGEIPRALGNCSRLRTLLLSSNVLRGVIPNELGKLRNLEVLDVSKNSLGGPLPANLGNCTNLSVLVLSTHFSPRGETSHGFSGAQNSFEGSIPEEIITLPNLKLIWAPGSNFKGNFPSKWGDCKSLKMLNLAQNNFSGEIFGLFTGKLDENLNLSSNSLTGKLDENLHLSCITMFDVSGNLLSGPIPNFTTKICHHFPSVEKKVVSPYSPSVAYLSFFEYKMLSEYSSPFNVSKKHQQHCKKPERRSPPKSRQQFKNHWHGLTLVDVVWIISISAAIAILLTFLAVFCYTKKSKQIPVVDVAPPPQTKRVTVFNDIGVPLTYDIIVRATENFNRRNCIGNGGFGSTYKAEIAPETSHLLKVNRRAAAPRSATVSR